MYTSTKKFLSIQLSNFQFKNFVKYTIQSFKQTTYIKIYLSLTFLKIPLPHFNKFYKKILWFLNLPLFHIFKAN